jgi:hypothetical protein
MAYRVVGDENPNKEVREYGSIGQRVCPEALSW